MDGDGRIPYGGSLGCLPAPCCPVSASCSARDLLRSHRLDTCVAYHPHLLRLYVYISSSAAGSHQSLQSIFYSCAPVSA